MMDILFKPTSQYPLKFHRKQGLQNTLHTSNYRVYCLAVRQVDRRKECGSHLTTSSVNTEEYFVNAHLLQGVDISNLTIQSLPA